jgi:cell division protein FtsB
MRPLERRRIMLERSPDRDALLRRAMAWVILGICALLLVGTVGETLARASVAEQVAAARQRVQSLQGDIQTTQRAIDVASSDAEIERQARQWGYIRPGDQPFIVVTPSSR